MRKTPRTLADLATLPDDALVTPGEVAALFRVDPKTVTRWAHAHHLRTLRTPGGHMRFYVKDIRALFTEKKEA